MKSELSPSNDKRTIIIVKVTHGIGVRKFRVYCRVELGYDIKTEIKSVVSCGAP